MVVYNNPILVSAEIWYLPVGAGLSPGYEGSEDYAAVPLPFFNVAWSNHMSINVLGSTAKLNLISSATRKGGLTGEYIGERGENQFFGGVLVFYKL